MHETLQIPPPSLNQYSQTTMKQELFGINTNSLFTTVFIDFPKTGLIRSSLFSPTNTA